MLRAGVRRAVPRKAAGAAPPPLPSFPPKNALCVVGLRLCLLLRVRRRVRVVCERRHLVLVVLDLRARHLAVVRLPRQLRQLRHELRNRGLKAALQLLNRGGRVIEHRRRVVQLCNRNGQRLARGVQVRHVLVHRHRVRGLVQERLVPVAKRL